MPKPHRHIWVVEMRLDGRWESTVEGSLSRDAGRTEVRHWREANPDDRFRLRRYVPTEGRDERQNRQSKTMTQSKQMWGDGRVFRRHRRWWIAYYAHNHSIVNQATARIEMLL